MHRSLAPPNLEAWANSIALKIAKRLQIADQTLLDLGSPAGTLALALARLGAKVCGAVYEEDLEYLSLTRQASAGPSWAAGLGSRWGSS